MCKHQSEKLWDLLNSESYINTLGSLSGNHAVQHAKGWIKGNLFKWMAGSCRCKYCW